MKSSGLDNQVARDVAGFAALLLAAVVVGLAINVLRAKPLSLVYQSKAVRLQRALERMGAGDRSAISSTPVTVPKPAVGVISLDEFQRRVERADGLILDARPEPLYRLGHVPGALSLPRDDFEAACVRLGRKLDEARNRSVAVYCSDADCEDSRLVAEALVELHLARVVRFKGGWAEWTAAHLPEERSQ